MGLTCLELIEGAKYITIEGNEFGETSSHAILIDDVSLSGWFETKPEKLWCEYLPETFREYPDSFFLYNEI